MRVTVKMHLGVRKTMRRHLEEGRVKDEKVWYL
jgi:hypothetical protein